MSTAPAVQAPPAVNGHDLAKPEKLRRLTVDIRVTAETIDDSPLADLVTAALREFIELNPETPSGKFESKAGLDVTWRALNRFYEKGEFVGAVGVNEHGKAVYSIPRGG